MAYQHIPPGAPPDPHAAPPAPDDRLRFKAWVPLMAGLLGMVAGIGFMMLLQQAGWVPFGPFQFWMGLLGGAFLATLGSFVMILVTIRKAHDATHGVRA